MKSTIFVSSLSKQNQQKIKELVQGYLTKEGYTENEINESVANVLQDRLCILSDFINIEPFLREGRVISLSDRC